RIVGAGRAFPYRRIARKLKPASPAPLKRNEARAGARMPPAFRPALADPARSVQHQARSPRADRRDTTSYDLCGRPALTWCLNWKSKLESAEHKGGQIKVDGLSL